MRLYIEIDRETVDRIVEDARSEMRPVPLHVTYLLRKSLGLPVPLPPRRQRKRTAVEVERQPA